MVGTVQAQSPPVAPDLSGSWQLDLDVGTRAKVPVLGWNLVMSKTTIVVKIADTEAGPMAVQTVCDVEAGSPSALAKTVIPEAGAGGGEGSVAELGRALFGPYALPFEITSLVLLAAIIGAIVLAKKKTGES